VPYDPRIQYHGDQYLYQGITSASEDIAKNATKALADYEKAKQQQRVGDMTMELGSKTINPATGEPYISTDELNKYTRGNHAQKQDFVTAKMGLFAQQLLDQKAADEHNVAQAHAAYYNAATVKPGDLEAHQAIEDEYRNRALQQQWDIVNLKNNGGEDNNPVITDPLKINDKEIPGIGVNRKTGQYVYFGESAMERDPKTGALGVRDTRGNFKPITAEQTNAMVAQKALHIGELSSTPTPTPTPVKVTTQADFDALPSGTIFVAPDGSRRQKP
jgi:hypothetical protein